MSFGLAGCEVEASAGARVVREFIHEALERSFRIGEMAGFELNLTQGIAAREIWGRALRLG